MFDVQYIKYKKGNSWQTSSSHTHPKTIKKPSVVAKNKKRIKKKEEKRVDGI